MSLCMPLTCGSSGWAWPGVAWCLAPLAPNLAPRNPVSLANLRIIRRARTTITVGKLSPARAPRATIAAWVIVRRVKDLNRLAAGGQDKLFDVWRNHAIFTGSPFVLLPGRSPAPRPRHRRAGARGLGQRTVGPPAVRLTPANAAWLACAALAHNQLCAAGSLANLASTKGQKYHAAPRPHRRRCPYRPPRPRPHRRAPARRLAPQEEWMTLFEASTGPLTQAA